MYYPKNKIKTGLYTNGEEYIIQTSKKSYIGKYWSTYDGKFFTGEGPQSTNPQELIKIKETIEDSKSTSFQLQSKNVIFSNNVEYNISEVFNYINISNNLKESTQLPTPYYPQPTEADYKLGEFQRYFCVKTNELKYTEVTKEQYIKFKNKDESVAWSYYIAFTLPWDITGNKEEVYKTNRNIVLITEQNINRRGLQEFLRKNYLKFCKETPTTQTTQQSPTRGSSSY